MQIRTISIKSINPAAYNPRKDLKPDDVEYRQLLRSINEFGCVQPLVWNKRTGNLVGGHQRLKILLAKGAKDVQVSVVDLSLEKEKALNIALNKISGSWDHKMLAQLLDDLCKVPDFDVELTGFPLPEIEDMLSDVLDKAKAGESFDVDAELKKDKPVVTKPGDLIELGPDGQHRLFCGDATKSSDVAMLMGDSRAVLCHTDPPYGVNYNRDNRPSAKKSAKKSNQDKISNDDLTPKRYAGWFSKVVDSMSETLAAGSPYYIWNSHKQFGLMHDLLTSKKFKVANVITWGKESFCPGFGDYNEQTEFCLYGWKQGAKHRWYGPKNESTLWRVNRDRTDLYYHPTQKALELAQRAIRNSSKVDDIVFDPFLGSGTTLIAAARLGRRCFGMEIEPKYCDCIVRRYIALAGNDCVSQEILDRYCSCKEVLA
ncbi:MAG: site-specific DNA-methyltransferase [Nitrospinales bacterium]